MLGAGGGHACHPHGGGGAFCDVVDSTNQTIADDKKHRTDITLSAGESGEGNDILQASEAVSQQLDDQAPKKRDEFIEDSSDSASHIALVGVVVGWSTHLDESDSIFGPVGLACETPCRGDIYDQDYFMGRNQFSVGQIILLTPHIDATLTEEGYLLMSIRGLQNKMGVIRYRLWSYKCREACHKGGSSDGELGKPRRTACH